MLAFMAHFYGGKPMDWCEENLETIREWHDEAVKLHNKMNPVPNG